MAARRQHHGRMAASAMDEFRGTPYYHDVMALVHEGFSVRRRYNMGMMGNTLDLELRSRRTDCSIRQEVSEYEAEQSRGEILRYVGRQMMHRLEDAERRYLRLPPTHFYYDEASSITGTDTVHIPDSMKPKKKPKTAREMLQSTVNKWLKGVVLPKAA